MDLTYSVSLQEKFLQVERSDARQEKSKKVEDRILGKRILAGQKTGCKAREVQEGRGPDSWQEKFLQVIKLDA